MTDAPDRISLLPDDGWSWMSGSSPHEETAIEYIRADLCQPTPDAATIRADALREAAEMIRNTAYTSNGERRGLVPVSRGLEGMDMHHATIAAAILDLIGKDTK